MVDIPAAKAAQAAVDASADRYFTDREFAEKVDAAIDRILVAHPVRGVPTVSRPFIAMGVCVALDMYLPASPPRPSK